MVINSPRCQGGKFLLGSLSLQCDAACRLLTVHCVRTLEEGIPAFEELFLYACPKFIAANPPPFENPVALAAYVENPPTEPAQRHLSLFISDVRAHACV